VPALTPDLQLLGAFVRDAREARGLSQRAFAAATAGLSHSTLARLEQGASVSYLNVRAALRGLGFSLIVVAGARPPVDRR